MRVFVYSSVRLFGESLGALLARDEVVTAVTVENVLIDIARKIRRFGADIVLYDVGRKRRLSAVRPLASDCVGVPIVALALPEVADEVIACADAGFVSYVPRDASFEELMAIMRMALRGEMECDPKIACTLLQEIRRRQKPDAFRQTGDDLTRRECEILRLLTRGLSNKAIAADLNLSVATVKNHVHAVLRKLQVKRRTEAQLLLNEKPWLLKSA
jgi:DNA-binding NarL/FixJ family response regulator